MGVNHKILLTADERRYFLVPKFGHEKININLRLLAFIGG